jgi:hypothetical protein
MAMGDNGARHFGFCEGMSIWLFNYTTSGLNERLN